MPVQTLHRAWTKEHPPWSKFRVGLVAFCGFSLLVVTQIAFSESHNFQQAKNARVAAAREKPTVQALIDRTTTFGRVVITEAGEIISWNHGMTKLVGWTSKEMVGGDGSRLDPATSTDESVLFNRIWSRRHSPWIARGTVKLKAKDGKAIKVAVSIRDLDGEPRFRELNFDTAGTL